MLLPAFSFFLICPVLLPYILQWDIIPVHDQLVAAFSVLHVQLPSAFVRLADAVLHLLREDLRLRLAIRPKQDFFIQFEIFSFFQMLLFRQQFIVDLFFVLLQHKKHRVHIERQLLHFGIAV